jgi:hypothetical protein
VFEKAGVSRVTPKRLGVGQGEQCVAKQLLAKGL